MLAKLIIFLHLFLLKLHAKTWDDNHYYMNVCANQYMEFVDQVSYISFEDSLKITKCLMDLSIANIKNIGKDSLGASCFGSYFGIYYSEELRGL